jgi:hypothetical protein
MSSTVTVSLTLSLRVDKNTPMANPPAKTRSTAAATASASLPAGTSTRMVVPAHAAMHSMSHHRMRTTGEWQSVRVCVYMNVHDHETIHSDVSITRATRERAKDRETSGEAYAPTTPCRPTHSCSAQLQLHLRVLVHCLMNS